MYIHICLYDIFIPICMCVYVSLSLSLSMYIYIYIYIGARRGRRRRGAQKTDSIHRRHHRHQPEGVLYRSSCLNSSTFAISKVTSRRWKTGDVELRGKLNR